MKRSTFLKTLGLSAAAAFCNIRVLAVPKFWLPSPERPDAKLPASLAREDLLQHILDGAMEFARDGIRVGTVERYCGVLKHMAMESAGVAIGEEMRQQESDQFIQAIRYVLEDSVRDVAACSVSFAQSVYDDPTPVKYEGGVRIYPFRSQDGGIAREEFYDVASNTYYIPKPVLPIFEMRMEMKARVMFDESQNPIGWCARAVIVRGEINPQ